jgi:hypothetical protein
VLWALSAPGFQSVNPPERLANLFAGLRTQNYDLSGVAVLEPQLTVLPELDENNVMRLAGYFPSVPLQVNFDLQFAAVEGALAAPRDRSHRRVTHPARAVVRGGCETRAASR